MGAKLQYEDSYLKAAPSHPTRAQARKRGMPSQKTTRFRHSPALTRLARELDRTGIVLLGAIALVASNAVPLDQVGQAATHSLSGPLLALSSALAGNLLLAGSIANLIVAQDASQGIRLDWRTHARIGIPVTLSTLGIAALALWCDAGTSGASAVNLCP